MEPARREQSGAPYIGRGGYGKKERTAPRWAPGWPRRPGRPLVVAAHPVAVGGIEGVRGEKGKSRTALESPAVID